ncbi:MAG: hypothetical protein KDA41_19695, partial [Planctomycetales bacterium]|nr:hypothetical protein [Planctomycetales bacterium]
MKRLWSIDLAAPPQQRAWTSLPAWPGPARHKMAMAVAPFADGGKPPHDAIFLISGGTWVKNEAGEMDLARFEDYADAYRFDPAKSKWTRLADLPKLAESRTIDSSGYAFDRKANAWKPATDGANVDALGQQAWFNEQPRPVTAAVAACDERGRVLVFSGATGRYVTMAVQDRPLFPQEVLAYDPARDQWTVAGKMPQAVVTTGAERWQGRIVIASGEIRPGVRTPNVQALRLAEAPAHVPFGALNWTVLLLYLAGMVGIGVWCSQRESSTEQFFLAGRRIPWWAAGLSIFGTQLSAITFMAIPATAFAKDWVRMIGNLSIMPVIVFVVFCLLPLFRLLDIASAYEYLELRFNVAVRALASSLFILFQLGRMGVVLFLPAIALSAVSGMNVNVCIVLMGVLATLYTVLGGIEAVIWTDVVQVIVLLGGALICVGVAAVDAGGVASMVDVAWQEDKFRLLVWDWSPSSFGVWVMVVGGFFTSLVPYATDQTVVQRYLTTKDERRAAGSLWLNFAMTVPAALIFYGLGTALFAFYANHPELAQPAAADRIVPWFVVRQLPAGIAGVVIAGV